MHKWTGIFKLLHKFNNDDKESRHLLLVLYYFILFYYFFGIAFVQGENGPQGSRGQSGVTGMKVKSVLLLCYVVVIVTVVLVVIWLDDEKAIVTICEFIFYHQGIRGDRGTRGRRGQSGGQVKHHFPLFQTIKQQAKFLAVLFAQRQSGQVARKPLLHSPLCFAAPSHGSAAKTLPCARTILPATQAINFNFYHL